MTATVYLATNTVNGKRYVGVTSKVVPARRAQHENHALHGKRIQCRFFHSAIRKYGPAAFEWTILAACETFEEGLREEVRLISEIRPEYNLTIGGQGSKGRVVSQEQRDAHSRRMKGRRVSAETIEKIAATLRGRKFSAERRANISAGKTGVAFSAEHLKNMGLAQRGKKQSPEAIESRSAARRGRPLSAAHRSSISAARMGHPGYGKGKKKDPEAVRRGWETRRKNQEAARVSF